VLPEGLPDAMIRKILVDNPLAAYPRLRAEDGISPASHKEAVP
jgi:hypothetical protein